MKKNAIFPISIVVYVLLGGLIVFIPNDWGIVVFPYFYLPMYILSTWFGKRDMQMDKGMELYMEGGAIALIISMSDLLIAMSRLAFWYGEEYIHIIPWFACISNSMLVVLIEYSITVPLMLNVHSSAKRNICSMLTYLIISIASLLLWQSLKKSIFLSLNLIVLSVIIFFISVIVQVIIKAKKKRID